MLSRCVDGAAVLRLTEDDVIRQLANALFKRQIVIFRKFRRAARGSVGKKEEEYAAPFRLGSHKRSTGKAASSKTWIFIVLNDSDSNPVAGDDYRIELPDGRVVQGKLDRLGTAAVSGINPRNAKYRFRVCAVRCGSRPEACRHKEGYVQLHDSTRRVSFKLSG
jgi:hypothetical protein